MDEQLHALYPDVVESDGLAAMIAAEVARQRPGAANTLAKSLKGTSTFWVSAEREGRAVQVTVAARQRLFMADFWDKGVQVGSLSSPEPAPVAGAILAFLADQKPATSVAKTYPEFVATPQARPHEEGAMAEVAFQWEVVKRTLEAEAPELLPLANTLSRTRPFSHLFPTVSLEALCFSRCTGSPYSRDCPVVVATRSGHFEVRSNRGDPLGEGDEQTALAALDAALPPDCGPAVQGTTDDLSSEAGRASA
jgi:hypothetical protein